MQSYAVCSHHSTTVRQQRRQPRLVTPDILLQGKDGHRFRVPDHTAEAINIGLTVVLRRVSGYRDNPGVETTEEGCRKIRTPGQHQQTPLTRRKSQFVLEIPCQRLCSLEELTVSGYQGRPVIRHQLPDGK